MTPDNILTKTLVLDAPVCLAWFLSNPSEDLPAESLLETLTSHTCLVPQNWWFETRNMLLEAEQAHRIEPSETAGILADLSVLPIQTDTMPNSDVCLALGRKHQISASEAAYLELATRTNSPLITLSQPFLLAAPGEGVETRFS